MYKYTLYALQSKHAGEIRYIGQTTRDIKTRMRQHYYAASLSEPKQPVHVWIKEVKEVIPIILEQGSSEDPDYINRAEVQWIDLFLSVEIPILNQTKGGQQIRLLPGYTHTEETKEKMRGPRKKYNRVQQELTSEHKQKISTAAKKYWEDPIHREEHRKRFSGENNPMYGKQLFGEANGFYGKHHSPKTRERMSEAAKNRPPISDETRKKLLFRNHNRWHVKRNILKEDCEFCN